MQLFILCFAQNMGKMGNDFYEMQNFDAAMKPLMKYKILNMKKGPEIIITCH